jgi:phosphoribosylformylglycinamidine synthase
VCSSDLTLLGTLEKMMGTAELCSRRWIWEQYDSQVGGDTAQLSGGDAGIVRVHGTNKGLAMTTDCTQRYCAADPVMGGRQAVVETYRNLCAVGATPLAITDNMNFGNPEKPLIMGQFVGAIQGIDEACRALDYPVVSGNCSLYNETNGQPILPAPVIGGVGLLDDVTKHATIGFTADGEAIFVIGATKGHIGQSLYLSMIHGKEDGAPPPVSLTVERRHGKFVRNLISEGGVTACHDVSDGGLLVALVEMALAGNRGCSLTANAADAGFWFGEDQGRYVVTVKDGDAFMARAESAGIPVLLVGQTGGGDITLDGASLELVRLRATHEGWLPAYMEG